MRTVHVFLSPTHIYIYINSTLQFLIYRTFYRSSLHHHTSSEPTLFLFSLLVQKYKDYRNNLRKIKYKTEVTQRK
jgi:hypothetical protein